MSGWVYGHDNGANIRKCLRAVEIMVIKNCIVILLLLFKFLFLVHTIFYLIDNDWDISFYAVLYISISHVDHLQLCF